MVKLKGFLNIKKPTNLSSHDVVYRLRKRLRELGFFNLKVGHTGTLDPFAEGVMLVSIGKATKLTAILQNKTKKYIANIVLGIKTDTDDITGKILEEDENINISRDEILKILSKYLGKISQKPPKFAAIKVNGKRLYEYARNEIEVEVPEREVSVEKMELLEYIEQKNIKILVECSSGTYIRALARDISKDLGTCGVLQELTRISVDKFCIENSLNLDDVLKFSLEDFSKNMIKIDDIFDEMSLISVQEDKMNYLKDAQLTFFDLDDFEINEKFILKHNDEVLGIIYKSTENKLKFAVNLM